jgi:hypothetical protein
MYNMPTFRNHVSVPSSKAGSRLCGVRKGEALYTVVLEIYHETGFIVKILLLTELYGLVAHNMFKTSHTKYCCKPVFLSQGSMSWARSGLRIVSFLLAFPNARYVIICRKTVVYITDLCIDLMERSYGSSTLHSIYCCCEYCSWQAPSPRDKAARLGNTVTLTTCLLFCQCTIFNPWH